MRVLSVNMKSRSPQLNRFFNSRVSTSVRVSVTQLPWHAHHWLSLPYTSWLPYAVLAKFDYHCLHHQQSAYHTDSEIPDVLMTLFVTVFHLTYFQRDPGHLHPGKLHHYYAYEIFGEKLIHVNDRESWWPTQRNLLIRNSVLGIPPHRSGLLSYRPGLTLEK